MYVQLQRAIEVAKIDLSSIDYSTILAFECFILE